MRDSATLQRLTPPQWPVGETAIFLDLDGTLIEFAMTPDAVTLPIGLPQMLMELAAVLGGAVAILSGRSVTAIEGLLGATPVTLSGVHGSELKKLGEPIHNLAPALPEALKLAVADLAIRWPSLLIEDKGVAIAVHVRQVPEIGTAVADYLEALVRRLSPDHEVMAGAAVFEIKPRAFTKGTALHSLMRQRPYTGRRPVFLGDDRTDEDGFAAAMTLGGHGIAVGPRRSPTANWHLASPADARQWLSDFAAQGSRQGLG